MIPELDSSKFQLLKVRSMEDSHQYPLGICYKCRPPSESDFKTSAGYVKKSPGHTDFLCGCAQSLSHVQLFVTPWTVAHQAPLSMGILQARILEWAP